MIRDVDIRRITRARDGQMHATKRGVTVRRGELDQVIEALLRARAIIDGQPDPGGSASSVTP